MAGMARRHGTTFSLAIGVFIICALGQEPVNLVSTGALQNKAELNVADRVTLTTPLGKIVIRLRTDAAPQSSAMFSRLVSSGLYNGCSFYRAEDFCIQGGLRTADGQVRNNPYGHFPFEYGLPNKRGTVTLARWEDTNSATGEFFINLKDSPHLDRTGTTGWRLGFAVFGQVESGMDVVQRIAALPTHSQGGMSMLAAPLSFQAQAQAVASQAASPARSSFAVASPVASPHLSIGIEELGVVPVQLLPKNAPHLVALFESLAQRGIGGKLHRAEGIPVAPSQGPPYALVQASLDDPAGTLAKMPHEGSMPIRPGSVCIIPGSSDFFISLGAHPGWEASMTIVGQVEPLALQNVVMPILRRPHHNFKHPTLGTVMSMLDSPLQIRLSLGTDAAAAVPPPADSEEARIQAAEASMAEIGKETGSMLRGTRDYL